MNTDDEHEQPMLHQHSQQHSHHDAAEDDDQKPDDEEEQKIAPSRTDGAGNSLRRDLQRERAATAGIEDPPAPARTKSSPWYSEYIGYIIALCIALILIYWFFNRAPAAETSAK